MLTGTIDSLSALEYWHNFQRGAFSAEAFSAEVAFGLIKV